MNNVWVQIKPEGEGLLVYEMDGELNPYDELSSCLCTTEEDRNAESTNILLDALAEAMIKHM